MLGRNGEVGRLGGARWIIAAISAGIVVGVIAWLVAHRYPDEQHLAVINNYADARCHLDMVEHGRSEFSVRKAATYRRTIGAPTDGFVRISCTTEKGMIETPGNFQMEDGGLAEVTFEEWGEVTVKYMPREDYRRPSGG